MAASTTIDPDATGDGLSAAGHTSAAAIATGTPTAPAGSHIAGAPMGLSGLLGTHLGTLTTAVTTGATAAAASVASYRTTEDTNQTSLST